MSLPSRERGSKPEMPCRDLGLRGRRRSLRGSVDRNGYEPLNARWNISRSLRGSVDRNAADPAMVRVRPGSLPSRERGSKRGLSPCRCWPQASRSLRGSVDRNSVNALCELEDEMSLPSRERGSKLADHGVFRILYGVAPFAGAWIETEQLARLSAPRHGRSLRGSVDRNPARWTWTRPSRPSLPSRERGSKR